MKDDRDLISSLFGFNKLEDEHKFHYLLGSLATFEDDTQTRGKDPNGRDTLSFGELALIHNYALELAQMTEDFVCNEGESSEEVLSRVKKQCKLLRQL